MNDSVDVMIDLETMGINSDAAIVSIGAVEFDIKEGKLGRTFYNPVSLSSAREAGGSISTDTFLWWLQQSDAARAELTGKGQDIKDVLTWFTEWLAPIYSRRSVNIWGNGAAFDNVILASAYTRLGMQVPWNFRSDRCYRTVKNLYPEIPFESPEIAHNSLSDAKAQAEHLLKIFQKIKG